MQKLITTFLLLTFYFQVAAQDTFIKTIDETNFGRDMRVIPTPDKGWVIFSLDSSRLYKFNTCGNLEWAKKYTIKPGNFSDFIKLKNGNFLHLTRLKLNPNVHVPMLTMLHPNGNLVWSKTYEIQNYTQATHTVSEDQNGNFFIYGSSEPLGGGHTFRTIIKTNSSGNILWSKYYSGLSMTWGGAIVTSDNGILIRAGSDLMKTDNNGTIQWATSLATTSSDNYYAPIEVSDGYILKGYRYSSGFVDFYKIDKQGNLAGMSKKSIQFAGITPHLYKTKNGNIAGVFQQFYGSNIYPTIVELDKDLNLVRQNSLKPDPAMGVLTGAEVNFFDDNSAIITGLSRPAFSNISKLFMARSNAQFQTGCDTIGTITLTTTPAGQSFKSGTVTTEAYTTVNQTISATNLSPTLTTICGKVAPKILNIRQNSSICENSSLELKDTSGNSFDSFLWSTGEKTASISVKNPGKYWLKAGYNCNSEFVSDTVIVNLVTFPQPKLTTDSSICGNKPVIIDAEVPNGSYRWQDGSTNPWFMASRSGKYEVEVSVNGCLKRFSVSISDFEKLEMPNIITPNGDEKNDRFQPKEYCGIAGGTLKIYNRWGSKIYETTDFASGWNGMVTGKKSISGIYYYALQYQNFRSEQKTIKGWVKVIAEK